MSRIPLPRLLDTDGRTFIRRIRPLRVSVDLNIVPLSTASIELPEGEEIPARSYVEVYTSIGSAGLFRVRSPQNSYGNDISASELEHAVVEVGDWLVRANYKEMMAADTAMQTVFSHYRGNMWQLGSVAALGSAQIALQANYDNVLTAMLALLEQIPDCMMTFDFSTSPRWTLSFAKTDTVVSAEGRLSRNINNARIIYDDSELCTRAYYEYVVPGSSDGQTAPTTAWATLDADTIGTYGVIEREVPTGNDFTAAEALRAAQEYIRKHKTPNISIEINAEDLSQVTGEALDSYRLGKLYRLAMPKHGITKEEVITGLSWDDVYGKPNEIVVMLADEEATAVTFLHDLDAKGGSGGGGGGGRKKADDEWKEFRAVWEVNDYHLMYEAQKWDKTSGIIEKAGLKIDSAGALIYAEDTQEMIGSKIKALSNEISLEVSNATTKAALILKITGGVSNARLSADVIDIDGVVTALGSKDISCGTLKVEGYADMDGIDCDGLNAYTNITAGGNIEADGALSTYGRTVNVVDASVANDVLTITKADGSTITFNKAAFYDAGWTAAYNKVTLPAAGTAATFTVYAPPATVDGEAYAHQFSVVNKNKNAVEVLLAGRTVAELAHNKYDAGWAAAAGKVSLPTAGTAATFSVDVPPSAVDGNAVSHSFAVSSKNDNTVQVITAGRVVAEFAHNKYDAGVAAGEANFEQATVTPQGSAYGSITPIGTPHKFSYTHLYKAGTPQTYYNAGTPATYYKGDGSTVTGRGDSVSVTPIGTPHKLRYKKLYTDGTDVQWAYVSDSTGSTTWYSAGTEATYYKGNGSAVTGRGASVSVTEQGSSVSVTTQGATQWAYVADSDGTTTYYGAGTAVTNLRNPGTEDTTTYFKKKATQSS